MQGIYGNTIKISIFGESHGQQMGITLDGLPPGVKVDTDFIDRCLLKRRPHGKISTTRVENDAYEFISGFYNGYTTGTPFTVIVKNSNQRSQDYSELGNYYRPSHADYGKDIKYKGYQDERGGGHFSGRLTSLLVIAGALGMQMLQAKGIYIATHILQSRVFSDEPFSSDEKILSEQVQSLLNGSFPVLTNKEALIKEIEAAKAEEDSIGAKIQTAVIGIPAGVGEPFFNSLESMISHLIFSVPAVKGIEFGLGFDYRRFKGSQVNDQFILDHQQIKTSTNNNGGIVGGISNGMPIQFNTIIKPTSSIGISQQSINRKTGKEEMMVIKGRHDPAIFHRACIVIDCVTALALCDALASRHGYLWLQP